MIALDYSTESRSRAFMLDSARSMKSKLWIQELKAWIPLLLMMVEQQFGKMSMRLFKHMHANTRIRQKELT